MKNIHRFDVNYGNILKRSVSAIGISQENPLSRVFLTSKAHHKDLNERK